jgi:hypothetical protein
MHALTRRESLAGVFASAIPVAIFPKIAPASPLDREELKLLALGVQLTDLLEKEAPLREEMERCGELRDARAEQEFGGEWHWLKDREGWARISRETGFEAAYDPWNAVCAQVHAVCEVVEAIAPKTLAGLTVRLLAMCWTEDAHDGGALILKVLQLLEPISARIASERAALQ